MNEVKDILNYWFGELDDATGMPKGSKFDLWFGKSEETDVFLTESYAGLLERAKGGELDSWVDESDSLVALVVLLDQFSRNIYRGTAKMYEADEKVLSLVKGVVDEGRDVELPMIYRVFVYMPFMHSEELVDQVKCVELFEGLVEEAHPAVKEVVETNLKYAKMHRDVVEKFGRFPHRNKILGRESSEAELVYLAKPGAGF